jgi:hypothetical protein
LNRIAARIVWLSAASGGHGRAKADKRKVFASGEFFVRRREEVSNAIPFLPPPAISNRMYVVMLENF